MRAKPKLWVASPPANEFETFAWRVQPFLFLVLGRHCRGMAHETEDLVHEVLLRTMLRWDKLKLLDEAGQRAWLGRVATNCFLDRCRRRESEANRVTELLRISEQSRDDDAREPELWEFITPEDLKEALARLDNQKERAAFELFLQGLSYAEIGERLGARSGTVGAWLTRARQGLRELLQATAEKRRLERRR
jgi:RNA polymerase sigma-70 factor (ECF subfamily)